MPDNLKNTPMADTMEFIETPTFTRQILALLPDDDYRGLQNELIEDPERGDIIKRRWRCPQSTLCSKGAWKTWRHPSYLLLAT